MKKAILLIGLLLSAQGCVRPVPNGEGASLPVPDKEMALADSRDGPTHQAESAGTLRLLVHGKAVGTAFPVANNNPRMKGFTTIVTAAHSLLEAGFGTSADIAVSDSKGAVHKVEAHYKDTALDVAILLIRQDIAALPVSALPPVWSECYSVNYSSFPFLGSNPIILSKGYTLHYKKPDIWVTLNIFAPGGSGAPLFHESKVIGMINSRILDENKFNTEVVHAVSIESVLHFINSIR